MGKIYVIRDKIDPGNCFYTEKKSTLEIFLKFRDPERYEWVKITKEKDIQRTKRLLSEDVLHDYGDFALTQVEFEGVQDELMSLPPCIMADIENLLKSLKFIKCTEEEEKDISEMLKIVHDLLYSIEEPPVHLDQVIDETFLFNEYLLAKKFLIERCL
ncbi:hypothetical protein [Romboutsia ilealis]|uniref:hypothetical protein n=1 Tax=Romboutsia ilealis TaxID=1115758 RepID=UPI00272B611E|nr:hypothetical protein [Romboutsia ilealis]